MQNYCETFLFAFNTFIMEKEGIKINCIDLDNLYKILAPNYCLALALSPTSRP